MANTILITGATGKTGRRIVETLASAGHTVRVGSRSATPRFDWAPRDFDEYARDAAATGVWAAAV